MQPTSRQDPWRRPDRRGTAENEDPGARAVPIGLSVRGLDRLDAKRSFDRRQGPARRYHASRRLGIAWPDGGRGYHRDPACSTWRKSAALACRASQAQVVEVGCCSAGQQDSTHRVGDDGNWGDLHREICGRYLGGCSQPRLTCGHWNGSGFHSISLRNAMQPRYPARDLQPSANSGLTKLRLPTSAGAG